MSTAYLNGRLRGGNFCVSFWYMALTRFLRWAFFDWCISLWVAIKMEKGVFLTFPVKDSLLLFCRILRGQKIFINFQFHQFYRERRSFLWPLLSNDYTYRFFLLLFLTRRSCKYGNMAGSSFMPGSFSTPSHSNASSRASSAEAAFERHFRLEKRKLVISI